MWKVILVAAAALAACAPGAPDDGPVSVGPPVDAGRGVGFDTYDSYETARIARERDLRGLDGVPPAPVTPGSTNSSRVISEGELAAAGLPFGAGGTQPATDDVTGAPVTPGSINTSRPLTPADVTNPRISDEQDFGAVSSRETIESDAARLERQRQAYQVIEPTAVPTRRGAAGPNIVAFALETDNAVGEPVHSRRGGNRNRFLRACAKFPSPDLAQKAFLEDGGPADDRLGVDPDGDGFACGWNPAPFRAARN